MQYTGQQWNSLLNQWVFLMISVKVHWFCVEDLQHSKLWFFKVLDLGSIFYFWISRISLIKPLEICYPFTSVTYSPSISGVLLKICYWRWSVKSVIPNEFPDSKKHCFSMKYHWFSVQFSIKWKTNPFPAVSSVDFHWFKFIINYYFCKFVLKD